MTCWLVWKFEIQGYNVLEKFGLHEKIRGPMRSNLGQLIIVKMCHLVFISS